VKRVRREERWGGGYPTISPVWVGRLCSLSTDPVLPAPGYNSQLPAALGVITAPTGVTVKRREAQFGRNPWVEGRSEAQVIKGVKVGMPFCAELLRSSR